MVGYSGVSGFSGLASGLGDWLLVAMRYPHWIHSWRLQIPKVLPLANNYFVRALAQIYRVGAAA